MEVEWVDVTQQVLEEGRKSGTATQGGPSGLGLHLIYDGVPLKRQNTYRGFEEGLITDIHAVFRRLQM